MTDARTYFEQAADALREAFSATDPTEQGILLDKALQLHRLAIAEERAKLAEWVKGATPSDADGFS